MSPHAPCPFVNYVLFSNTDYILSEESLISYTKHTSSCWSVWVSETPSCCPAHEWFSELPVDGHLGVIVFAFWSMLAEVVVRWAWPPALHAPGLICVMVLLASGASEASCHIGQYLHGRLDTWILERDAAASTCVWAKTREWFTVNEMRPSDMKRACI